MFSTDTARALKVTAEPLHSMVFQHDDDCLTRSGKSKSLPDAGQDGLTQPGKSYAEVKPD